MMNIHTVAAGGGSRTRFRRRTALRRPEIRGLAAGSCLLPQWRPAHGNRRAGAARPHPAGGVFRRSSVPAATSRSTPASCGAVRRARRRPSPTAAAMAVERLAAGFLDVAVESMARAIRHVSVREGHDPAEFALLCYGGAAPQHACRVADSLGITEILIHPLAGVLSAWGIGLADRRLMRRQSLERTLDARTHAALDAEFAAMTEPLVAAMIAQGAAPRGRARAPRARDCARRAPRRRSRSRTRPSQEVARSFRSEFDAALRLCAAADPTAGRDTARRGRRRGRKDTRSPSRTPGRRPRTAACEAWFDGWREVPLLDRVRARAGAADRGTRAHRRAEFDDSRRGRLVRRDGWMTARSASRDTTARQPAPSTRAKPIPRNSSSSITGSCRWRSRWAPCSRRRPSRSTSASASIFPARCSTREGALIANAPHMPVHLGSMGASVRAVIAANARRAAPRARLDAECALRRRNAPSGHHGREPGVRRRGGGARRSSSPRARTTPTSAASRRARCRPPRARSRRKACCSTTSCCSTKA